METLISVVLTIVVVPFMMIIMWGIGIAIISSFLYQSESEEDEKKYGTQK